jgi:hypothetical protein
MKRTGLADSPLFRNSSSKNKTSVSSNKKEPPSKHDSKPSCNHDVMIADIAKAIREIGKEVCTYRLTEQEKTTLVEIIYHYRMQKYRLSENEIARIAINFIIQDFNSNKKDCILSRIIELQKA